MLQLLSYALKMTGLKVLPPTNKEILEKNPKETLGRTNDFQTLVLTPSLKL